MASASVSSIRIKKYINESSEESSDLLVREEPMEIQLSFGRKDARRKKSIYVTMRTPGNDFELALGFLYAEGIIRSKEDINSILYCENETDSVSRENIVRIELKEHINPEIEKLERNFYTSSSCGVCGKASIEALQMSKGVDSQQRSDEFTITTSLIHTLNDKLREKQILFEHTGGLHAAALFDIKGNLIFMREDIGRHNAVDKIIGALLEKNKLPCRSHILFLSGRAGYELLQKATMAEIPCVASVGAPSSLAAEVATEFNITLIGFVREKRFNVYSGFDRVKED